MEVEHQFNATVGNRRNLNKKLQLKPQFRGQYQSGDQTIFTVNPGFKMTSITKIT